MGKKAVKGKYSIAMLSLVFIGQKKKAKYSTDTVVFFRNKTFSIRSFVTKRIA